MVELVTAGNSSHSLPPTPDANQDKFHSPSPFISHYYNYLTVIAGCNGV